MLSTTPKFLQVVGNVGATASETFFPTSLASTLIIDSPANTGGKIHNLEINFGQNPFGRTLHFKVFNLVGNNNLNLLHDEVLILASTVGIQLLQLAAPVNVNTGQYIGIYISNTAGLARDNEHPGVFYAMGNTGSGAYSHNGGADHYHISAKIWG